MSIRFDGRVALVTGAGSGLGRVHALALAKRGAKVLVNDWGGDAQAVADEICLAGGQAWACPADVTDFSAVQSVVEQGLKQCGRLDILVNNAGILRDKSFAKMDLDDFALVINVHVMGAMHCCKAVWDVMRAQNHGRIIMTTSSSGLWGNFGQANYAAAKMALVGLMNTLAIEGESKNIRVNALSPTAATRMTEGLLPPAALEMLKPEAVTPALIFLASDEAPTGRIVCAGAGSFETAQISLTKGVVLGAGDEVAEALAQRFPEIADRQDDAVLRYGMQQGQHELKRVEEARQ